MLLKDTITELIQYADTYINGDEQDKLDFVLEQVVKLDNQTALGLIPDGLEQITLKIAIRLIHNSLKSVDNKINTMLNN